MNSRAYNLTILDSLSALRDNSEAWDDLLARSSIATPLARAEMIAQWVEKFALGCAFRALVVKYCDKFIAALPIVGVRKGNIILAGVNPSNEWAQSGQFLVDFQYDTNIVGALIADGLDNLPFSILWFDYIREDDKEWIFFNNIVCSKKLLSHWHSRYSTAVVEISDNFAKDSCLFDKKSLSNIKRIIRKHYLGNNYEFLAVSSCPEISNLLFDCFEIENAGWKGKGDGGSILKRNMQDFISLQAMTLCETNEVILFILKLNDIIISFRYGLVSKNTVFMLKTSYDNNFREYAPGQVLTYFSISDYCYANNIFRIDFTGEFSNHQKIWNPKSSMNSQVVVQLFTVYGKFFFCIYNSIMPKVRFLKRFFLNLSKKISINSFKEKYFFG